MKEGRKEENCLHSILDYVIIQTLLNYLSPWLCKTTGVFANSHC